LTFHINVDIKTEVASCLGNNIFWKY